MCETNSFFCNHCNWWYKSAYMKNGKDICWACYKEDGEYIDHLNKLSGIPDFYRRLRTLINVSYNTRLTGKAWNYALKHFCGYEPVSVKDFFIFRRAAKRARHRSDEYAFLYDYLFTNTYDDEC